MLHQALSVSDHPVHLLSWNQAQEKWRLNEEPLSSSFLSAIQPACLCLCMTHTENVHVSVPVKWSAQQVINLRNKSNQNQKELISEPEWLCSIIETGQANNVSAITRGDIAVAEALNRLSSSRDVFQSSSTASPNVSSSMASSAYKRKNCRLNHLGTKEV